MQICIVGFHQFPGNEERGRYFVILYFTSKHFNFKHIATDFLNFR